MAYYRSRGEETRRRKESKVNNATCDTCGNAVVRELYRVEGYDATYTQCRDDEACTVRGREILQRFFGRDYSPRTQYRPITPRKPAATCCGGH
jgi:hypothetical protein